MGFLVILISLKKDLLAILCLVSCFACGKDGHLPSGTLQTEGTLHYDDFPDGFGLYYRVDFTNEMLLLRNSFASDSAQYEFYKKYVNEHTRLFYLDSGDTGCVYGFAPVCGLRRVEYVKLEKE
jgi:hypothetical protein